MIGKGSTINSKVENELPAVSSETVLQAALVLFSTLINIFSD